MVMIKGAWAAACEAVVGFGKVVGGVERLIEVLVEEGSSGEDKISGDGEDKGPAMARRLGRWISR